MAEDIVNEQSNEDIEIHPDDAAAAASMAETEPEELLSQEDADAGDEGASAEVAEEGAESEAATDCSEAYSEEDEEDGLDSDDSLTYSNGVIEKIVAMATREVPHVLGMKGNLMHFVQERLGAESLTKGVTVEVTEENSVIVNISVIIEYGAYAPDIFENVKERVTERLAAMTGLEVAGINLRIEDVLTPEEYAASSQGAEA
ncbi:Asp23/Gls24 family envelope stress response protein [Collinsella vaginalis]|uniref:Asp23/Gls24 family envelope stress response protein n=1 Tax=Collinsella vaginalis TaxID=1870987 RepID=UPI000A27260F|nr:Asp23/Gls24 family envelope stress response protein [Collinsella vaginalis]